MPFLNSQTAMALPTEAELLHLPLRSIIAVGWRAAARAAVHRGTDIPVGLEVSWAFCLGKLTALQAIGILDRIGPNEERTSAAIAQMATEGIRMAALWWASHPERPEPSAVCLVRSALFMAWVDVEKVRPPARDAEYEINRDLRSLLDEKQQPFPFLGSTIDPTEAGPLGALWPAGRDSP
jgi:hypothetical protein